MDVKHVGEVDDRENLVPGQVATGGPPSRDGSVGGEEEHADDREDRPGSPGDSPLREQDRYLPIANVSRIMKNIVPTTGKVAKEAKECVQEAVSEFISFVTSEASEKCMNDRRKTVNGDDIIHALDTLGFDNYVESMRVFMQKYRDSQRPAEHGFYQPFNDFPQEVLGSDIGTMQPMPSFVSSLVSHPADDSLAPAASPTALIESFTSTTAAADTDESIARLASIS